MLKTQLTSSLVRGPMIDNGAPCPVPVMSSLLDDPRWIDLTPALAHGVYVLRLRGRVIYIGRGRVPLENVANHRALVGKISAAWMPTRGVRFDEVLIRPSHPDRSAAEVAALIEEFDPPGNRMPVPLSMPEAQTRIRRA